MASTDLDNRTLQLYLAASHTIGLRPDMSAKKIKEIDGISPTQARITLETLITVDKYIGRFDAIMACANLIAISEIRPVDLLESFEAPKPISA